MRFDDRLATVLSQPAASPHDRAIRWRQLVDLVARSAGQGDESLLAQALDIIRADAPAIDEGLRAATARAIAGLPVPVALLSIFASDGLAAAAPLLTAVPMDDDSFARVRAAASDEVRQFMDSLRPPKAATPEGPAPAEPTPQAPEAAARTEHVPSIGEVVARIERLRSSREQAREMRAILPLSKSPRLFRWECNPSGEIDWVEGVPRGPLVGRSIATADIEEGVDDCVERAFGVRAPFRDCMLELGEEGPLAGHWMISGVPAFSPADGRFIGYRGVARREETEPHVVEPAVPRRAANGAVGEYEALREMIHEIKTPLNAIIGFAEIIDGQYFGPAHSRYRERAAEIVANARSLLEAAEDLDFAARLQSARDRPGEGTDFASFFPAFADGLMARAARLGVIVDLQAPEKGGRCTLDPELTERLLRRFTDAVLSATAPGEHLGVQFRRFDHRCGMSLTRPRATMLAGKDELLNPEFTIGEADRAMLGLGFSLRLVNGLVGIAGGSLEITPDRFELIVPMMD